MRTEISNIPGEVRKRMKAGFVALLLLSLSFCSWASDSFWTFYIEAENFNSQTGGNKASSEYFPYIGEGYLEMGGENAAVAWNNVSVPNTGKYTLLFKYANNTEHELPCSLKVNGKSIKKISFAPFPKNWEIDRPEVTHHKPETVGWAKYWNARVIVDLKAGANTLELIVTSEAGGPHIDNIGISTALASPPAPVISVKNYGAIGDGRTDNSDAIAKAIAACPYGGSVLFEEGVYMTGSVILKANMTLWISEGAVIRAIQDNDKMKNCYEARFQGDWFTKYFVFGNKVDNLTITGGGAIDGNAVNGYRIKNKPMRPVALGFINSNNVKVTNINILNSDAWCFIPQKSDNIIIDGINLYSPNKDGIAAMDCDNTSITNCVLSCGDDAIVPKSYDPSRGLDSLVVKNVTINYCKWKGIKYGGATRGNLTNAIFEDLAMVYTHSGLALYSTSGCTVQNIKVNRIKMNNPYSPFFIIRGASGSPYETGIKDVYISNIEARNVYSNQGSTIQGAEKDGVIYPVQNIFLTNVIVKDFKGGLETVPAMPPVFPGLRPRVSDAFPEGYPETLIWDEFPAWAYFIRFAENVVFTNVTHDVYPADAREAIVIEEVSGFKINKHEEKNIPL